MSMAIERTKHILRKQIKKGTFSNNDPKMFKYYKVYPTPTENTKESLKYIDLSQTDRVLTAVEGLTQPFDIAAKGVKSIDVFDNNALNEYFIFGLMMALFNKYSYKGILTLYSRLYNSNTSLEELNALILGLLPHMDIKYRHYWKEIVDYNYNLQKENPNALNLFSMLSYHYANTMAKACGFLANEEEYNKFKHNLYQTNIKFTRANPLNLHKKFSGNEYDLIYLASSLDHLSSYGIYNWDYEFYKNYINQLKTITDDFGGLIAANAIEANSRRVWRNSNILEEELKDSTIHKIPSAFDETKEDLLVLNRKVCF